MIIKSLARKQPTFDQLVAYCRREEEETGTDAGIFGRVIGYADREGVALFALARNLGVAADDRDAVIRAFQENYALLPRREGSNALYHEILSLDAAPGLSHKRQVAMLTDMASFYVARRAPHCLAYGVIHTDTDNLHCHLVISANTVGSRQRHRLSKKQFTDIQREVERYRLDRYPELGRDPIYTKERAREGKQRSSEVALKQRTGKPTRKEQIRQAVEAACRTATSMEALTTALARDALTPYCRGSTWGVLDQTSQRKYRLKTLGVEAAFLEAQARIELARVRVAELRSLSASRPRDGRDRSRDRE